MANLLKFFLLHDRSYSYGETRFLLDHNPLGLIKRNVMGRAVVASLPHLRYRRN
jgi:hypothetical protein